MTSSTRRNVLKLTGVAAVTGTLPLLPSQWRRPVIESIVLPAHAQTSAPVDVPLQAGLFAIEVGQRAESGGSLEPAIIALTVVICATVGSSIDVSAVATLSPGGSIDLASTSITVGEAATATTAISVEAPIFAPVANVSLITLTYNDGATTETETVSGTTLTEVLTGSNTGFAC